MAVVAGVRIALCAAVAALAGACASSVETAPTTFVAAPTGGDIVLTRRAEVQSSTLFKRVLAEGSRWRKVGTVPQGHVYRPLDTVFTIEGRHVHEAYLVIAPASFTLVGFYLPGESTFSALAAPIPLAIKEAT